MDSEQEFLDYCKSVAGDKSNRRWDETYLAAFFHSFRPSGNGIEKVFQSINNAEEVVSRLKLVYSVTSENEEEWGPGFERLTVTNPLHCGTESFKELALSFIKKMSLLCEEELKFTDYPEGYNKKQW
ncbi:hypothetical protein ACFL27_22885 [candidate division CSSED10-310 bacterium]|uniref:Uncharacterized protein n=1 Tax=candidate division CSSED10-310 bacterium TaxID=2855610 RepID=A0ABV6Z3N4_UNCC1